MKNVIKSGMLYFGIVFGTGFLLGPVRVLWLVPRVGVRNAELMEMPLMLSVIFFAARWIVRHSASGASRPQLLAIGLLALGTLLLAEFVLVLRVRGLTLEAYLAERDPVSGTVYLCSILLFGFMPLLVSRRK